MKRNYYSAPQVEIIEIETEDAILNGSGDVPGGPLEDFEPGEDWGTF